MSIKHVMLEIMLFILFPKKNPLQLWDVWECNCSIQIYSDKYTVRGPTRGRMLITEFYTARLQSDQSDLSISNSEYKQRHTRESSSAK